MVLLAILANIQCSICSQLMQEHSYQQLLMRQVTKLQIDKASNTPFHTQKARFALNLWLECKQLFKKQRQTAKHLSQILIQKLMIQHPKQLNKLFQMNYDHDYGRLMINTPIKYQLIGQINLRLVLMGLGSKFGQNIDKIILKTARTFISQLQIQIMLDADIPVSNILIQQLIQLQKQFNNLDYYEQLSRVFKRMEIIKVNEWLQQKISNKRQQFGKNNNHSFIPITIENKIKQTRRVTIHLPEEQRTKENSRTTNIKNKTQKTKKATSMPKVKTKEEISTFAIANKRRMSIPHTPKQFASHRKYIYRSQKQNHNEENNEEFLLESPKKETPPRTINKELSEVMVEDEERSEESKGVLCPATPPRRQIHR